MFFFWQRFHCQMSAIHALLIMVAFSIFQHLHTVVKCWRHFPFLALARKKSLWRWWWWWYYFTDIYNKKPSFTLTLRKIVLMATPRHQWQMSVVITGSPNAPPVPSPLFYAMAQSKICKYFKPRWQIEPLTPFAWVSWLTESEIFDSKSKSLPCFPPSWPTHYFWGKNEKYHKGRYRVIQRDCRL